MLYLKFLCSTSFHYNFGSDGQISGFIDNQGLEGNFKLLCYLACHGIFIGFTVLFNTIGLRFYAKSMAINGAANATVYNFWFAYIASLICGALFFNEVEMIKSLNIMFGVFLMVIGVVIISSKCLKNQLLLKLLYNYISNCH